MDPWKWWREHDSMYVNYTWKQMMRKTHLIWSRWDNMDLYA